MIGKEIRGRGRFARGVISAAIVALGFTAGAQRAMGQFTLSSEDRSLFANVTLELNDDVTTPGIYNNMISDAGNPGDMTGDSISSSATGSENSDIEVTGFSGNGSADSTAEVSGIIQDSTAAQASSSFTVTFTVPVATGIQLMGELDSDGNATDSVSFDTFSASGSATMPTQPFSFSEILQPGISYTLSLSSGTMSGASIETATDQGPGDAADSGDGSYTFNFNEVSVPEPTSLAMLALGAPALLARRRRAGASASAKNEA